MCGRGCRLWWIVARPWFGARKNTRKLVGCILGLSDSELGFRSYTIHGFSSSNILRRRPWDTSFKEVVVRGEF